MSTDQCMFPENYWPEQLRHLWHQSTVLMHGIARWRAAAADSITAAQPFAISRDDRQEFLANVDATHDAWRNIRGTTAEPWVQTTRLLVAGRQTEVAICALLMNGGRLPEHESPRELELLRQALSPITAEDYAVWLEQIHAEIRRASSSARLSQGTQVFEVTATSNPRQAHGDDISERLGIAPVDDLEPLERALALLVNHSDWTDSKIADEVGVNRTTLYKPSWAKFQAAREAIGSGRSNTPRGQKNMKTGDIEAWEPGEP